MLSLFLLPISIAMANTNTSPFGDQPIQTLPACNEVDFCERNQLWNANVSYTFDLNTLLIDPWTSHI